jgi:hypothetical protein
VTSNDPKPHLFVGPIDVVHALTRLEHAGVFTRPEVPPVTGEAIDPIRIGGDEVTPLMANAARRALDVTDTPSRDTEIVWSEGGDELVVDPAHVEVRTTEGTVLLSIPVRCDETGPATVEVAFAVGAPDRPAGLFGATEERPRGPVPVVDRWADALIAFAWSTVLELAGSVAGAIGNDEHGDALIAGSLVATNEGIEVVPFARPRVGRLQR